MQSGLEQWIPKQHAAMMRSELKKEWNYQCAYCGVKENGKKLTIDHIIPLTKGGTDDWFNLIPACRSCNLSKNHKPVRQWYFDQETYTLERWQKIKKHMAQKSSELVA